MHSRNSPAVAEAWRRPFPTMKHDSMTDTRWPGRGLYAITDGPRADLLDAVALALAGGARIVQYRDAGQDPARRRQEAAALRALCERHHALLLVEDDMALAQAAQAHGVHLDRVDGMAAARAALGAEAILGVSCRDSLATAQAAVRAGADYVSFGAFHASPTKPLAPRAPLELLRQSAALGVPRVAIGGITPDNGAPLVEAGADCLAAISALFGAGDIRATAQRYTDLFSS